MSTDVPAESLDAAKTTPPRALPIALGVALAAVAVVLVYWLIPNRYDREAEAAAVKTLNELGAIVVPPPAGEPVLSVNLETIKTPEEFSQAIKVLPGLARLTTLEASRTEISDDDLAVVSQLSDLKSLSLILTKIGDAGVSKLAPLGELEMLNLSSTAVTDECLATLSKMDSLQTVDLSATKVAGAANPFPALPKLQWLLLRNTKLADGALSELHKCPELKRVSLEGSTVSQAAVDALIKSRPELKVIQGPAAEASDETAEADAQPPAE